MRKNIVLCLFFFLSIQFFFSEKKSDRIEIKDFDRYRYESILNRKGCKFDFFETQEDAVQYAKLLFQLDKNTDKKKDYKYSAYDAGENWMIYIFEKAEETGEKKIIVDKFSDENEYIIIFKKGTGEVLRFERY